MSSFKTYFGLLSVKDPTFGAVGNGSTDDTAAIQAAFTAAFGSPSNSNGNTNRFSNIGVYFPAGNYRVIAPLYIVGAQGGRVFGNGTESTTISFENPGTGNTLIPTVAITGTANNGGGLIRLTCNTTGMSTSQVKVVTGVGGTTEANGSWVITVIDGTHLDLQGSAFVHAYTSGGKIGDIGSEITPCIMLNGVAYTKFEGFTIGCNSASGSVGIYSWTDGTYFNSANLFVDLLLNGFQTGILGGYGGSGGNCDNHTLINCYFNNCTLAGVRVVNQNALNWAVYGGGAASCASTSTGPAGNGGAAYSCVTGGLSPICNVSVSGNEWDIIGQGFSPITVIGGSSESTNAIGLNVQGFISGFCHRNATSNGCTFVDCSNAGSAILSSCFFNPGTDNGAGNVVKLGNNGIAVLDNLVINGGGASCVFSGTAGSKLTVRSLFNQVGNGDPFSGFTGEVKAYDFGLVTVANLPTAAAKFQGIRSFVTDATATTFLSTVAGTGSNKVPVVCDGTNWKIG